MKTREDDIAKKWGPLKSQPDEQLKKIARDLYNGLIYTSQHCKPHEINQRFMVTIFMGPRAPSKPKYPNVGGNKEDDRDNVLYDVLQRDADKAKYEEEKKWHFVAMKYYEKEFLPSLGLIYEYLDRRGPLSLNGGPIFDSARFLNIEDTNKVFEYYETYKKIRKEADNF